MERGVKHRQIPHLGAAHTIALMRARSGILIARRALALIPYHEEEMGLCRCYRNARAQRVMCSSLWCRVCDRGMSYWTYIILCVCWCSLSLSLSGSPRAVFVLAALLYYRSLSRLNGRCVCVRRQRPPPKSHVQLSDPSQHSALFMSINTKTKGDTHHVCDLFNAQQTS